MVVCFTAPDQVKSKPPEPVGRDDAMIFWSRPRLIAKIGFNLAQPSKIAFRREDCGDTPDLADVACSRDRTDAVMQFADEGVDDFRRHVCASFGVQVEQAVSPAEVEQVAVGAYQTSSR